MINVLPKDIDRGLMPVEPPFIHMFERHLTEYLQRPGSVRMTFALEKSKTIISIYGGDLKKSPTYSAHSLQKFINREI